MNREEVLESNALGEASQRDHLLIGLGQVWCSGEYRGQATHEVQCSNLGSLVMIKIEYFLTIAKAMRPERF